ncbi:hypothetical protein JCM6882_005992 [Rhodosporidiobolus microsporus]
MLVQPVHRSTAGVSVLAHRAFTSSPFAPSSSSRSPPPPAPKPVQDPLLKLYKRVFRTAARGAAEIAARESGVPATTRSNYIHQEKFKANNVRRTPWRSSEGGTSGALGRRKRVRGALVDFDAARLAPDSSRRSFSTSAAAWRVAEESLTEAQEDDAAADWGWEQEGAGAKDPKGKGRVSGAVLPGDYVESTMHGLPLPGIYLGRSTFDAAHRGMLLSVSGTLHQVSLDSITFGIPAFADPSTAASLSPSSPDETAFDPSTPAVSDFIQLLRRLELAVERETQQLVSRGAHDLYRILLDTPPPAGSPEALAKRKPSPPSHTTARTALRALQLPVTPLHPSAAREERLLALHRLLIAKPEHFIADPIALKSTGRFDLRPRDEVDRFEQVRECLRFRTKEAEEWAAKAAKVREWAQVELAKKGPRGVEQSELKKLDLPADDPTFAWTASDLTFLSFIRDAIASDRTLQEQPHMTLAPTLVKLVDDAARRLGYSGWGEEREIKRARLRAFLSEVGAVAPWEDWTAHERTTGLQEWDARGAMVQTALDRAKGKKPAAVPASGRISPPTSTEFYPSDPHDSVRHDFGTAKVYTIDDPGASELDDGISIAPAAATSDGRATHWVHVHVADPTALVHPGHLLAKLARVRDHTEYFPEKTWAMLPESFTQGQKLSLGSMSGAEQRVLSFGMRVVEETGEVVESEVKAGVVRKVMRLTYGAVDRLLGYEAPAKGETMSFGPAKSAEEEQRPGRVTEDAALEADAEAASQLRTLRDLADKLLKRRVASSAIAWTFPRASVSVSPSPLLPHFTTFSHPVIYGGAPRIDLHLPSAAQQADQVTFTDSPASLIVSEMMVAANRAAAKFAVERGLGVPFRQQGAPLSSRDAIDAVFALRNPDNGFAPGREVIKHGLAFAPGQTLATAGPHWPMGIQDDYGYVQATSPLRRYSDLFAHYQLKSALLPPSSTSSAFAPAFSGAAVQSHIDGFNAARKSRFRLSEAAETFWALWVVKHKLDLLRAVSSSSSSSSFASSASLALTDADHSALALLSSGLTAVAIRPPTHSTFDNVYVQRVLIPQLGVRGSLQIDKPEMAPLKGEEVPVKIEEVVLSARSSLVVSLRR